MKQILYTSMLSLCLLAAAPASAALFSQEGGFTGPTTASTVTVADAKGLSDETPVVLKGRIESHLRKDYYLFTDSTGSIVVEIDRDEWRGQTIGPKDTVIIRGELEREWFRDPKVDVDSIELVKK